MAGQMQRRLVQGGGRQARRSCRPAPAGPPPPARRRPLARRADRPRPAAPRPPRRAPAARQGSTFALGLGLGRIVDRPRPRATERIAGPPGRKPADGRSPAAGKKPASTIAPPGADDRFRPDAGRVAHRDGDARRSGCFRRVSSFDFNHETALAAGDRQQVGRAFGLQAHAG